MRVDTIIRQRNGGSADYWQAHRWGPNDADLMSPLLKYRQYANGHSNYDSKALPEGATGNRYGLGPGHKYHQNETASCTLRAADGKVGRALHGDNR